MTNEIERLTAELAAAQEKLGSAETECVDLANQNKKLRNELQAKIQDLNVYIGLVGVRDQEIATLQARLGWLTNDHPDDEHPPRYWRTVEGQEGTHDECVVCALEAAVADRDEARRELAHYENQFKISVAAQFNLVSRLDKLVESWVRQGQQKHNVRAAGRLVCANELRDAVREASLPALATDPAPAAETDSPRFDKTLRRIQQVCEEIGDLRVTHLMRKEYREFEFWSAPLYAELRRLWADLRGKKANESETTK